MAEIDNRLQELKREVERDNPSESEIIRHTEDILQWLTENNTDENCRKVDLFVATNVDPEKRQSLPGELSEIFGDMGGALHDTHTAPEIARNFESTPEQLLARLQAYKATISKSE